MAETGDSNQTTSAATTGLFVPNQFVISGGSNINIEKLEGISNYATWKFQMKLILIDNNLWEYATGRFTEASDLSRDQKAYAKICLLVKPICYPHVRNAKSAAEAWNNLRSAYENMGISRRLQLKRKLSQIKYVNYSTMDHYLGEIISVTQELADIGCTIDDEELAEIMLIGLSSDFDSLVMAIEATQVKLTSEFVKSRLIQGEFKRSDCRNMDTKDKALAVKNKFIPVCHHCKKEGHIKPKCPELRKGKHNKRKQLYNASQRSSPISNAKDRDTMLFSTHTALVSNSVTATDNWILDSGCTRHMTNRSDWLTNFVTNQLSEIIIANGNRIFSKGVGNVDVTLKNNDTKTISNVLFVPNIAANLLSVSKIAERGYILVFDDTGCRIYKKSDVNIIGSCEFTATQVNGVYKLDQRNLLELSYANTTGLGKPEISKANSMEVWHRRLGHLSLKGMLMLRDSLATGISFENGALTSCIPCIEGKQKCVAFPKGQSQRARNKLELIHSDLCGPMSEQSWSGSRYFITFTDDFSRKSFVYFLKTKDQNTVLNVFIEFKNLVENQSNLKIKRFRSDNGSEYCNRSFMEYFQRHGIVHETTVPYTPQQNGVSERLNRTIMDKARAMLQDSGLKKSFWAEAVNTAVYLKNCSPTAVIRGATPQELWTGSKVDLSHLRIFGCRAYALTPQHQRRKLDPRSKPYIMVGYCAHTKGYRLADPINPGTVITARSVEFLEDIKSDVSNIIKDTTNEDSSIECTHADYDYGTQMFEQKPVSGEDNVTQCNIPRNESTANFQHKESNILDENDPQEGCSVPDKTMTLTLNKTTNDRAVRERRLPFWHKEYEINYFTNLALIGRNEPQTVQDVMASDQKDQWMEAMKDEYNSLISHGVWQLVERPNNVNIVKCKWVFREKTDADGNLEKYKARLVARGFTQRYGIDYEETFAPVVRHSTLRTLFAIGVEFDMDIEHIDVSTAFLNGDLKETIYMEQPVGFEVDGTNKVCLLKKSLYGLKQASRAWNEKVHDVLIHHGYKQLKSEKCVYIKDYNQEKVIIALYVDDFFVFSNNKVGKNEIYDILKNKFKIKILGPVKQVLGMKVDRNKDKGILKLSQGQYIKNLLIKFGMTNCHKASTPMEVNLKLEKASSCDTMYPYQELIGSIMYLAVCTRPDIAYVCSKLSQYNTCFNKTHWLAAKRVLRYLLGTIDYGLTYRKGGSTVEISSDADWAGDIVDRRSYTGLISKFGSSVINWESRKQQTVACSSTEAEYYGLGNAVKEAKFLRNFFSELQLINFQEPITIYNDNQSTHKIVNNQVFRRTKHIDVIHHFVREAVDSGQVLIKYKASNELVADLLTKPLSKFKHERFIKEIGLHSCDA